MILKPLKKLSLPFLMLMLMLIQFSAQTGTAQKQGHATGLEMAVRMAESEMVHFPESWTVD